MVHNSQAAEIRATEGLILPAGITGAVRVREPHVMFPEDDPIDPSLLVSLVSVWGRNWFYLCGTVETVAECETVEIANIDAVFMHVAENMVGWRKRLGEYPTLSPLLRSDFFSESR
jgi:hypothetical protein